MLILYFACSIEVNQMQSILSQRVLNIAESETLKMSRLAGELREQGHDVISLSLGEPDFDTPDFIKEAAWQALQDGYTKYSPVPGLPALRQAILRKFKRENNLDYSIDQIVVSNGAKQSISNLAMALLNPGDEALLMTPYWVSYYDIAGVAEGVQREVYAGIDQDFKVSPEQLHAAISPKTKYVIFSSPSNPTGSVYTLSELQALAEVFRAFPDVIVISDEIYEYINFSGQHHSIATIDGMKERTVVVNGFSKGFAMTGWRLGYMAAPTWLAKACSKIQSQCTSGANTFSQMAGAVALDGNRDVTKTMTETYKRRKNLMRDGLNSISGFRANDPQGAFYIFPDCSELFGKKQSNGMIINTSDDLCTYLLSEAHVACVSGEAFGAPECIRLSFAASDADLRTALDKIQQAVRALS